MLLLLVVTRLLLSCFLVYQKIIFRAPFFFKGAQCVFWALHIVLETIFLPIMFLGFKYYLWAVFNYHMFMPSIVLPYLPWLFYFYPWSSLGALCLWRNLTSPMFQQFFLIFIFFFDLPSLVIYAHLRNIITWLFQWFTSIQGSLSLGFVSDLHSFKEFHHLAIFRWFTSSQGLLSLGFVSDLYSFMEFYHLAVFRWVASI